MLLNTLGIQCVPMDVVRLSALAEHEKTIKMVGTRNPSNFSELANQVNVLDPLSFWAYAGWSRKLMIEGFENPPAITPAQPIMGYIIPQPVVPKRPPPSTNSNGGLINIA